MAETGEIAKVVRELAALLDETGLTEIEYEEEDRRIRVARTPASVVAAAPAAAATPVAAVPGEQAGAAGHDAIPAGAITSPMVGTCYRSPEPGAKSFVEIGDEVSPGQTLLLIEAMKTFNEIRADRAGKVVQIFVESGTPVEYGDPLLVIA